VEINSILIIQPW